METSNRHIVHLDLDTFFVSVERLINSSLNGRPVLVGGTSDRAVVSSCSYEARGFGVHAGMPMKLARQLCGDAVVLRGDMEMYSRYSNLITDIIAAKAPLYEKASIDEHYIDITGMDRFFGSMKWVRELRRDIMHHSGLPISVGLSVNKTVSKIATGEAKPNGELWVEQTGVGDFMAPLSIKKIPMLGDKSFRLLRSMGIADIATLRTVPPDLMEKVMGKNGRTLWKKANGIDPTPVIPYFEGQSISTEHTFQNDSIDVTMLRNLLTSMVEKIAWELRSRSKLTSCITVKIRYSNFDTHTLQKRIPYTAFDHVLIRQAHDLFERLYQRRMLVRLIGVRFSYLVQGVQQIDLFDDTPEMINLYQALDAIRNRFGSKAVRRAVGIMKNEKKTQETVSERT